MRSKIWALGGAVAVLALGSAATEAAPPAKKAARPASAKGALKPKAADALPSIGEIPDWVRQEKIPAPDPKHKDDPVEFLLSNSQERLTPTTIENYVEYVVRAVNQAGLQAIGNVSIPWNIDRAELTLNKISIERDGKSIDALKGDDVSVIRRETKLEQSTLTGIRTVVVPVRGLQVGDSLRVAVTYKTRPRSLGQAEEMQDMAVPIAMGRVVKRFVVSKELPVQWSVSPSVKAVATETPTEVERVFTADHPEPPKKRDFVPTRFKHQIIQVSAFKDWGEVAAALAPMFDSARKTADGSEVAKLAEKIAAKTQDPHERLLAILRSVQDDVRYVALLLGDGDYKPMTADEVWAQRFGDCKGKTALILALLDRLGIAAEPVLASVTYDDMIPQRLPTLAMFDHVYVRAHVGPETFYLDGTQYGQRTLEELRSGSTLHVLPLLASGAKIETISDVLPSAPLNETAVTWDARNGILGDVSFEARLILRGASAAEMRAVAANADDREKLIEGYKDKVFGISNDKLEFVSADPEVSDGSFVVNFKGKTELDWSPVDGMKGNRLELTQSVLRWDAKLDREEGEGKDLPVSMQFPY